MLSGPVKVNIAKENWSLILNEFNKTNQTVDGFASSLADKTTQLGNIVSIDVQFPPNSLVGAKGDYNTSTKTGTDDTVALNAIINYANTLQTQGKNVSLYFGNASYKITAPLNTINNFISLVGGNSKAGIYPTHNGNVLQIKGRGHVIKNILISGKSRNDVDVSNYSNQVGIYNENSPFFNSVIENCNITVGGIAVYAKFNSTSYFFNNTLKNNIFNDNGRYAIKLESSDVNNCWYHCNQFEKMDCVSNGYGGIKITGFKSSQNNSFKKINLDGNGNRYASTTDEKFGIIDDTSSSQYNNIYEQLYFEGINVVPTDNIDSNNTVGALILYNFDTVSIKNCIFSNNTRDMLFITSGGKVGNCIIETGMIGTNNLASINKKSPIQIKGAGKQAFDIKINLTYGLGSLSLYDIDSVFVGFVNNPYDVKYRYTREDISVTHKVFAVKIASKNGTTNNVFNHAFSCKLTFVHDNTYNQQSLYAEYAVANNLISLVKSIGSGSGTRTIKFVTDGTSIYLFVGIYGAETYPALQLYFTGLYNDKNVVSIPSSTIVASYSSGVPTWQSGVTEITLS